MEDLNSVITTTKLVLQPLFLKPKLSSKLLSKPPFRFIHDIVTATIESTGFPDGLFSSHELQSSTYKDDKSAKLAFLDKLINLVSVGIGSVLGVSSSKIVAGLEPFNTNILLTAFGRLAVDKELDRSALIRHCRDGLGVGEFGQQPGAETVDTENPDTETGDRGEEAAAASSVSNDAVDATKLETINSNISLLTEQVMACNEDMDQTINMISSIVSKPKCSEKLLSKPPFRFLHDLFMAIGNATGFDLSQVFSNEQMNSVNIKDKQDKLEFLEKLIRFLEIKASVEIDVKPSKIVAGLEAERTRYLLQVFVVSAKDQSHTVTQSNHQNIVEPLPVSEEIELDNKEQALAHTNLNSELVDLPSTEVVIDDKDATLAPPLEVTESDTASPAGKHATEPESPPAIEEEKVDDEKTVDDCVEDEELPEFGSWLGDIDEATELEATKLSGSGPGLRLHSTLNQRPTTSLMLPARLSAKDLDSIAAAVQGITELTDSLGNLMGMLAKDVEVMKQERSHWNQQMMQT